MSLVRVKILQGGRRKAKAEGSGVQEERIIGGAKKAVVNGKIPIKLRVWRKLG